MAAGSGFISRNNDDPTAQATFDFTEKAALEPSQYVIWNIVPWWNGTRRLNTAEIKAGLKCAEALLGLLHHVRVVVAVGREAQQAASILKGMQVMKARQIIGSHHPSPIVRARYQDKWLSIPYVWAEARKYIERDKHGTVP